MADYVVFLLCQDEEHAEGWWMQKKFYSRELPRRKDVIEFGSESFKVSQCHHLLHSLADVPYAVMCDAYLDQIVKVFLQDISGWEFGGPCFNDARPALYAQVILQSLPHHPFAEEALCRLVVSKFEVNDFTGFPKAN